MFLIIQNIFIFLLIICWIVIILITIQEKINLKNNVIIIDNKYVEPHHFEQLNISSFTVNDIYLKPGDEITLEILNEDEYYRTKGTILGGKVEDQTMHIVTRYNQIKEININHIVKCKLKSRYGKFIK